MRRAYFSKVFSSSNAGGCTIRDVPGYVREEVKKMVREEQVSKKREQILEERLHCSGGGDQK